MRKPDVNGNGRHTFNMYLPNGRKKQGLRCSFLKILTLRWQDHAEELIHDGIAWNLYVETPAYQAFADNDEVKVIVSFQAFYDGAHIAVARLYREKMQGTVVDTTNINTLSIEE